MTLESVPDGPRQLVEKLVCWSKATPWVTWVELAGSLGRGAGDERSDVDAGIGVNEKERLNDIEAAVHAFAPVAAWVREPLDAEATHLITVYRDGRQLSLVVAPENLRTGIPPEAIALVDKKGQLDDPIERRRWDPDASERQRLAFVACLAASDALKHSARGNQWRALRSLNEGRDLYLQLLAAKEGVVFPQFGAVSLENAGRPIPPTLARTLVSDLKPESIHLAVIALMTHLKPFVDAHNLSEVPRALGLPDL